MSPGPNDPITDLAAMAVQLHELYESYLAAGFTEHQALYLVGRMVTPRPDLD